LDGMAKKKATAPDPASIPALVKAKAEAEGVPLETLRKRARMSNSLFYEQVMAGKPIKKLATLERLRALGIAA
jgi:hypothetical protein